MTSQQELLFTRLEDGDAALAAEVAEALDIRLPDECVAGVAANARIIQRHVDILRGGTS